MKNLFIVSFMVLACVFNAEAAIKVNNNTANRFATQEGMDVEEFDDEAAIATLENDIKILDEEIAKCEKQKKGWIAATVVGGVGVLSTGVAAGVQGVKIKDQKNTIAEKNKEIKELQKQSTALGN